MNKISADLFLELVADPTKYRTYLEKLEAEQQRLNAVIETVGKASELEALRKDVEKQREKLESVYTTKLDKLDTEYKAKLAAVEKLQTKVEADALVASKVMQEANQQSVASEALAKTFADRERALRKQEALVESMKAELGASVTEYNDKLAKLRSVMV